MPIPHAHLAGRPSSLRFETLCHGVTLLSRRPSAAAGGPWKTHHPRLPPTGSPPPFLHGVCVGMPPLSSLRRPSSSVLLPQNPHFDGRSPSRSSKICPARAHNCIQLLVLVRFCFPRIHILMGRLHRIHPKFAPRAHTIACFCSILLPQNLHFDGPSPSHSSKICPTRARNCLFLFDFASPESTF